MKKVVLSALAVILLIPTCVLADVYYVPPSTQTVYVAPDPTYTAGAVIGQAIANSRAEARTKKQQKAFEEQVRKLQEQVDKDVLVLKSIIEDGSLDNWNEEWKAFAFDKGASYNVNNTGQTIHIVLSTTAPGGESFIEEQTTDFSLGKCRIIRRFQPQAVEVMSVQNFDVQLAEANKKAKLGVFWRGVSNGYYIEKVGQGGRADIAGIKVGDIVTKIDGNSMEGGENAIKYVFDHMREAFKAGRTVRITVLRDNQVKEFTVK